MSLKIPPTYWKVIGVMFTSIVAPISIRHIDDIHEISTKPPVTPQQLTPATRIVAHGSGASPEAAFQNAIDAALQEAIVAQVSAADWKRYGQTYLTSLRHNGNGILRGWRELSSMPERNVIGRIYRSEVAVEVDEKVLRERLHLGMTPHGQ